MSEDKKKSRKAQRAELLHEFDTLLEFISDLPSHAMLESVTQFDLYQALSTINRILHTWDEDG